MTRVKIPSVHIKQEHILKESITRARLSIHGVVEIMNDTREEEEAATRSSA